MRRAIEKDAKNHFVTHNSHPFQIHQHIFYRLRFLYSRARAQTRLKDPALTELPSRLEVLLGVHRPTFYSTLSI